MGPLGTTYLESKGVIIKKKQRHMYNAIILRISRNKLKSKRFWLR